MSVASSPGGDLADVDTKMSSPVLEAEKSSPVMEAEYQIFNVKAEMEVNNKEEGSSFSAQRATLPFMEEKCKVINMFTESSVGCPGCERSWRRIGWQPACLASFLLRQTNIPETKGTPWAETPFWALRSW